MSVGAGENINCANCRFLCGKECRKFPPAPSKGVLGNAGRVFPVVKGDDWCGYWELIPGSEGK